MPFIQKLVVILIGPPGSGKGTQAEILAERLGLVHFEISQVIEEKFKDSDPEDEIIKREKKYWQSGDLMTPEIIVEWTLEKVKDLSSRGLGIVTSGNPRTVHEAEQEIPILEELYGKDNIKIVHLNLTKEESIRRNSSRRICEANRHSIPDFPMFKDLTKCPKDGSPLLKRELDNPETIGIRYEVYLRKTQPILSFMEGRGHSVIEIEGEQQIEEVRDEILTKIGA